MRLALMLAGAALGCAVIAAVPVLAAEKYPLRPIRLVAPFPPGGGTDILSRIIAVPVSEALGQPVVVDNRPGAGGSIGAELVARSDPDGHTLCMVSSSYAANAAFHKLPYDPVNGIQSIILIGTTGLVVTVHPAVPAQNLKELIAHARANPGKLNYATVGPGSVTHLSMELFKLEARVNLVHIPYKGGGPALTAAVAGEVQITAISLVPTLPHLKAGRLRAVGVTTPRRQALLPDVPAISEVVPGYEVMHWYGMWGPKGMPRDIVMRWNKEVAKVLLTEQMTRQMKTEGLETAGGPPDELHKVVSRDVEKWRRTVRDGKIKPEA